MSDFAEELRQFFGYPPILADYLINCSRKYKYVYIEVPKTGCSSIKRNLQLIEAEGDYSKLPQYSWDRSGSPIPIFSKMGLQLFDVFEGNEFFRFTLVRNPFSRILSCYLDKITSDLSDVRRAALTDILSDERRELFDILGFKHGSCPSFLQFLEAVGRNRYANAHWTPQSFLLNTEKIRYHFIGRFEEFSASMRTIINKIALEANLSAIKVNFHRTDARLKVEQYVRHKERDMILSIYSNDFEQFGYSEDPSLA